MIVNSWPGSEWEDEKLAAYVGHLMPLDARNVTLAVGKAVKKLKYRPSIAELLEFVRIVERESIPDGEVIGYMPLVKIPKPHWVLRWERARAAGDMRPFPEQLHALTALSRVDESHYAAYAPPDAPITDRAVWVQEDEYLEAAPVSEEWINVGEGVEL
jgi:hypothetical protein